LDREVRVVLEEVEIAVDVERGKDVVCVGVGVAGRSDETGERWVDVAAAVDGGGSVELGRGVVESEAPSAGSDTSPSTCSRIRGDSSVLGENILSPFPSLMEGQGGDSTTGTGIFGRTGSGLR
jgi:hypothetical protein